MIALIQKLARFIKRLAERYPDNRRVAILRKALLPTKSTTLTVAKPMVVALQLVEDQFYFAVFGAVVQELRSHRLVRAELVVMRAISGAIGVDWRAWLMRSVPMTWILTTQWARAYQGVVDHAAYRSQSFSHPVGDLIDWFRSLAIWRQMKSQQIDFRLKIRGVPVDDLIIDSYLRFRPSPRFDVSDSFVLRLIWQAHRDVRRAQAYFGRRRPDLYLTSYSTYLEHGIPVRAALQAGVAVYSFGNFVRFGKRLSLSDWFHTHNCEKYREVFESLDKQQERLAQAEQQLQVRLSGGIDVATSYMRASAYAGGADQVPAGIRGAVVVFLHDFYDSPHIYPDLVFDDFWAWICFTIETLQKASIRFYLKPHPNQISISSEVVRELQALYPDVQFLPQSITNVQLADAGMLCGVTVYGTVSHELAYLGVPSITSARHPHHAFDFCRNAKSITEYAVYLQTCTSASPPLNQAAMREQALMFFYMHNLYADSDGLKMRTSVNAFWQTCLQADEIDEDLIRDFSGLQAQPDLRRLARTMLESLN